ncbi:MAG: GNAT family N-acetyltransferase [Bacilli bacterium]
MDIIKYTNELKQDWDEFIFQNSCNGTFLQSRKFLEYHEKGKFIDNSLLFYDKCKIIAVIPAHIEYKDGEKSLISHNGTTFGGIVFNSKYYNSAKMEECINSLELYLKKENFDKIILRITPRIFTKKSPDLIEYMLEMNNFSSYSELSSYINYSNYNENILMNFAETKRKQVRRLKRENIEFRALNTDAEIEKFYYILELNLQKHGVKPIHNYSEILDFKNNRLVNIVKFYGVFVDNELTAAGMLFDFSDIKTIHAQNLSIDPNSIHVDTITYLYYSIIELYYNKGYKYLSWGKSTEDQGKVLNYNLIRNKEAYGSEYDLNKTYLKKYTRS